MKISKLLILVLVILNVVLSTPVLGASEAEEEKGFIGRIGNSIELGFVKFRGFLEDIHILWLNLYWFLIVLIFFGIIGLCITLPIRVYPYYVQLKQVYNKIFSRIR